MADQWRPYDAPGDDAPPPYPAYAPGTRPQPERRRLGLLVAGGVLVLGGAAAAGTALALSAVDEDDHARSTTTTTSVTTRTQRTEITVRGGGVDAFTTDGTRALREALVRETGSALVHEVVLMRSSAVLTIPDDAGPRTLVWDGRSLIPGGPGVSDRRPFDLARLDGAVAGHLCRADPLACTAIVGRPRPGEEGAWLTVAGPDGVHRTDLRGATP